MEVCITMIINIERQPSDEEISHMAECPCNGCTVENHALGIINTLTKVRRGNIESPLKAYYNLIRYLTAKGLTEQEIISIGFMLITCFSDEPIERIVDEFSQLKNHKEAQETLVKISIKAAADMGVILSTNPNPMAAQPSEVM